MSKFGGAVLEMLNKEKDEETGEEYDVMLSLKYFFPAEPKPREKAKPLTNDQQLQNGIYRRMFSKLWRWCREETKNRVIESASRAAAKKSNSESERRGKESSDKAADESDAKSRHSEHGRDEKPSSGYDDSGPFGGADGTIFSKPELIALQELSINRFKFWIEEDEDKEAKRKKENEESNAAEAQKLHQQFVRAKDR